MVPLILLFHLQFLLVVYTQKISIQIRKQNSFKIRLAAKGTYGLDLSPK